MTSTKLPIKIKISERIYPLRIDREEEEKIRVAAKMINEGLTKIRSKRYSGVDAQDELAMLALQMATKIVELEDTIKDHSFTNEINLTVNDLKKYLEETQDSVL